MYKYIICCFLLIATFSNQITADELITSSNKKNRPKIGLALSGGAAKSFTEIGVLKVIEELNIPIDYIAGTSMGSIIAALYAIGYNAKEIERIAKNEDWLAYFNEEPDRRIISIEEKNTYDEYGVFIEKDEENNNLLPTGFLSGQKISLALSRLMFPAHYVKDFNQLPIPFAAVAMDIETGEAVLLNKGNLADALRASMSLPYILNPVEMDNKLLVDGGFVVNFPVSFVKEMGADIVIGVDVTPLLPKKEEIKTVYDIMNQISSLHSQPYISKNRDICDILIIPDPVELRKLYGFDFKNTQKFIDLGEKAARLNYHKLKQLADKLKGKPYYNEKTKKSLPIINGAYVKQIEINNENRLAKNRIIKMLKLDLPEYLTIQDIETMINDLYASLDFEKITYELVPFEDGTKIIIFAKERREKRYRIGTHFDDDLKGSLLLNYTERNYNSSQTDLKFRIGENLGFSAKHSSHTIWKSDLLLLLDAQRFKVPIYEENHIIANYFLHNLYIKSILQYVIEKNFAFGFSCEYNRKVFEKYITVPTLPNYSEFSSFGFSAFFKMDTLNKTNYPTEGKRFFLEAKTMLSEGSPLSKLLLDGELIIPLKSDLVIHYYYMLGLTESKDDVSEVNHFFLGYAGKKNYNDLYRWIFPFVGTYFAELDAENASLLRADLQYKIQSDLYLILKISKGYLAAEIRDLYQKKPYTGIGISLGYDSLWGPMEISIMKSSIRDDILTYFNLGLWF